MFHLLFDDAELPDCSECRLKGLQGFRNCPFEEQHNPNLKYAINDRIEITMCPRGFVLTHSYLVDVIKLWKFYRQRFLPENGGILDQEYKLMLLFNYLDKEAQRVLSNSIRSESV